MLAVIQFPNISPEVFPWPIFGYVLPLRWYALAYIAGILIGWRILIGLARRPRLWGGESAPFSVRQAEDFMTWAILGIILGGRLGFVLFYQPGHYLSHPLDIPKVWQGGMSFHGGFLGVVTAVLLYARKEGIRLSALADGIAVSTPVGLMLGRIANFINAELWGRPSDLPWAVVFPGQAAQDCPGVIGPCARHPSQLYEAGLEGVLLGLVLWLAVTRFRSLSRPWMTTGLFVMGYGMARFVVEFFRLADAEFITPDNPYGHVLRMGEYGLTMGQLLSLPMIAVGLALALWAARRPPR
ncbi:prolipoprotein diacylglyceryl transferase [Frigidibacter sp. ROC022]|uniref:prolipoprotein diacylglyceryl transferase n=1 Tax=Frigidibacter sp. ROC022 TaxID=2971796 RepID=UPI00215A967A|nr:prolipoprotein diacylglyceryl transferase [Frigidibacter sp. ROC022]MCR8726259.1 prolipoprotein diacylglyceryl transferase [Frigidibacter sp. ROC022]